jgi:hypothetical protein
MITLGLAAQPGIDKKRDTKKKDSLRISSIPLSLLVVMI